MIGADKNTTPVTLNSVYYLGHSIFWWLLEMFWVLWKTFKLIIFINNGVNPLLIMNKFLPCYVRKVYNRFMYYLLYRLQCEYSWKGCTLFWCKVFSLCCVAVCNMYCVSLPCLTNYQFWGLSNYSFPVR